MEGTKKSRILKTNLIIFLLTLILVILYLGSRAIFSMYDLYYRTWMIVVGDIAAYVLLPLVVFALPVTGTVQWRRNRPERGGSSAAVAAAGVIMAVVAFVYFSIGMLAFVFMAGEEFEKERMLADGILEGVREENYGLESYTVYYYYEPIAFFLKKPYEPLSHALERRAGETYGEEFAVCEADKELEQQTSLELYTLYSVEHPEIVMHMFAGKSVYGISDDYLQAKANWLLSQNADFMEIAKLPEEVPVEKAMNPTERLWKGPKVLIFTEEHGERVAGIIAQAIAQVLEDEAFQTESYKNAEITLLTWYSDYKEEIGIPIADYADEEWIKEKIAENFENYVSRQDAYEQAEPDTAGESGQAVEPDSGMPQTIELDTGTPQTIEGAYLCLYEAVFETQGEPYEYGYNAKGNFYASLADGSGLPQGGEQELRTERTVVYDRVSENGKCHLFVYYETYYNEDGTEYATAIRNTYAVDMDTGAVIPSQKQAWEDVGTEEYQAATGEK